jgi:hypothetical protein
MTINMSKLWKDNSEKLKLKARADYVSGDLSAKTLEKARACEELAYSMEKNRDLVLWLDNNVITPEMGSYIFSVSERTMKRWYSGEKDRPNTIMKMIEIIDGANWLEKSLEGFEPRKHKGDD